MSFLRGPLTRSQVRELSLGAGSVEGPVPQPDAPTQAEPEPPAGEVERGAVGLPPTLPADVPQVFLPATVASDWALHTYEGRTGDRLVVREKRLIYAPHLLAMGTVYLADDRKGIRHEEKVVRLVEPNPPPAALDWEQGQISLSADALSHQPVGEGAYLPVPRHLADSDSHKGWSRAFSEYLYRNVRLPIWYNPELKLYGQAGESRRDFRVRCEEAAREQRDAEVEKEKEKFEKRIERVEDKLRRERRRLEEEQVELAGRRREETLSGAESVIRLISGRRSSSALSTASRRRRMTQQAKADVEESRQAIEDLERDLEELKEEWREKEEQIAASWAETLEEVQEVEISPRRTDVVVDYCGLAWIPSWEVITDAGQRVLLPAFETQQEE
jgi:hypothetical protein